VEVAGEEEEGYQDVSTASVRVSKHRGHSQWLLILNSESFATWRQTRNKGKGNGVFLSIKQKKEKEIDK
jgi:hypothetical protein